MRAKKQTSLHLLLASIVTMFGIMLILITVAMSWEFWMVPVILIGNTLVWCLHIGRAGSETFYENLCAGLLMIGFFSLEYIELLFLTYLLWHVCCFLFFRCLTKSGCCI